MNMIREFFQVFLR